MLLIITLLSFNYLHALSILIFLIFCFIVSQCCRLLTHNGVAAWRSGGVHYRSCGVLTFNFALHFLRSYTRHCAKPLVIGSHSTYFTLFFGLILSIFTCSWSSFVILSRLPDMFLNSLSGCNQFSATLISNSNLLIFRT